jgi:hypothetical protein
MKILGFFIKNQSSSSFSRLRELELAPVPMSGCQGFKGPDPSAFLDKSNQFVKDLVCRDISARKHLSEAD